MSINPGTKRFRGLAPLKMGSDVTPLSCFCRIMRRYSCPQSRWTKRFRGLAPLKMGIDVIPQTSSTGLRHPSSLVEGAGKRCSERGHPFVPFLTHVTSLREAGSPDSAMSINQACGRFPGQCHPGLGLICDGCIHPDAVPQDL